MTPVDPWIAALGGVLIGLSAWALLALNGRIAGISGIFAGLAQRAPAEVAWRALFLAGLIGGIALHRFVIAPGQDIVVAADWGVVVAAGLLVGFGTRLGGGCTSGHGICGISRLSARSVVATATFVGVAVLTVAVVRQIVGG